MQPKATGNKNSDRPKAQSWRQTSMLGIIPTILPQWCGNLKTCAKNGKKIIIKAVWPY